MHTNAITDKLLGELHFNEPLADYTSWRVGGPVHQLYKPADLADLSYFLSTLPANEPITWLGLGSNVLIRDGGIDGTAILTLNRLNQIGLQTEGIIRAEAGVTCAKLAKYCATLQLAEGAFFAGIPGTVGGALAMNAGAFGGTTWLQVLAVEMMDRQGKITLRSPADFAISYREVKKPIDEWFVAGHFRFLPGDEGATKQAIRELLKKRAQTQPIGEFSCGSVFRNPPGDFAARLIESCGLKNLRIGGAHVSAKHANFIVNDGTATAADIENLLYTVQAQVEKIKHVHLIPECHIIGKPSKP